MDTTVCVSITTYNSGRYIRRCLDSVLEQQAVLLEVVVVDNASTDATREILKHYRGSIRVILNRRNEGFAAAQNHAIRASRAEWVLCLNPDVLLEPGFIRGLVDAGEIDPDAGSVCGKLLSIGPGFQPLPEAAHRFHRHLFHPRHAALRSGLARARRRRFDHLEYVFGAQRRRRPVPPQMIDDVAIDGDFFDPDFFVYREDADVAWRAQLLGWRCPLYARGGGLPRAHRHAGQPPVGACLHQHALGEEPLPDAHQERHRRRLYRRCWLPMTARDLLVVGGCLLASPARSRPFGASQALPPRACARSRVIMSRRRVSDEDLAQWFSFQPAAEPLNGTTALEPAAGMLEADVSLSVL